MAPPCSQATRVKDYRYHTCTWKHLHEGYDAVGRKFPLRWDDRARAMCLMLAAVERTSGIYGPKLGQTARTLGRGFGDAAYRTSPGCQLTRSNASAGIGR